MVYAVIDTNIFVSSFITKNETASTKKVIRSMFNGQIKPLYNDEILEEYSEVLHRSKFHLDEKDILGCSISFEKTESIQNVFLSMAICLTRMTEYSMK